MNTTTMVTPTSIYIDEHSIESQVYGKIHNIFHDFSLFDVLVSKQLMECIADIYSNRLEINMKTTKSIFERYYKADSFVLDDQSSSNAAINKQKILKTQVELILKTTLVYILSLNQTILSNPMIWCNDITTFLATYPDYNKLVNTPPFQANHDELNYLFAYRNYLKVALELIPAKMNKNLLLKIASRLEGSRRDYVTGGGQRIEVTRREEIYEKETNVPRQKKTKRSAKPIGYDEDCVSVDSQPTQNQTQQMKKRQRTYVLPSDLKTLKLTTEELQYFSNPPAASNYCSSSSSSASADNMSVGYSSTSRPSNQPKLLPSSYMVNLKPSSCYTYPIAESTPIVTVSATPTIAKAAIVAAVPVVTPSIIVYGDSFKYNDYYMNEIASLPQAVPLPIILEPIAPAKSFSCAAAAGECTDEQVATSLAKSYAEEDACYMDMIDNLDFLLDDENNDNIYGGEFYDVPALPIAPEQLAPVSSTPMIYKSSPVVVSNNRLSSIDSTLDKLLSSSCDFWNQGAGSMMGSPAFFPTNNNTMKGVDRIDMGRRVSTDLLSYLL